MLWMIINTVDDWEIQCPENVFFSYSVYIIFLQIPHDWFYHLLTLIEHAASRPVIEFISGTKSRTRSPWLGDKVNTGIGLYRPARLHRQAGRCDIPMPESTISPSQGLPVWIWLLVLRIWIRDPVPFWPLDSGSGMGKKSRSGSGMNIPDHISESLETIFWGKIHKFFVADPRSFWPWIRDGKIPIRDPQHWVLVYIFSGYNWAGAFPQQRLKENCVSGWKLWDTLQYWQRVEWIGMWPWDFKLTGEG